MKDDNKLVNYSVSLRYEGMEIFAARGDVFCMEAAGKILIEMLRQLPETIKEHRGSGFINVLQFEITVR